MTSIARAPPGANDVAVRAELVCALFESVAVPLMNLVIVVIAAIVLWPIYPAWIIFAWMGASVAVAAFRLALWLRFRRRRQDTGTLASWAFTFTLASAAMGCLWGLLASTVFVTADPVYIVFTVFVLGGMSAGAATHNSPHLPAYYGFTAPAALPVIVALLTRGAAMPIGMGLMLLAFAAVLTVVARDNNRRLVDYIRMKIEQAALNDELQELTRELEKRSATDSLTGAWNRAQLDRVIASELDRSLRFRQPVSLIMLDIDHFKQVNDTYGHRAGDAVLCELVEVIGAAIRSIDTLFRWGGEEFVVVAPFTGYRGAERLAEAMRSAVEQHHFAGVGSATISLGVTEHIAAEDAETWFHRVDEALYRAKTGGRNRVCIDERGNSDIWAAESGLSAVRLKWQEAYECGEPTIDAQHRELFELANVLFDAAFEAESSPQSFRTALEKLLAHIERHFADEEALLAQHHYKDIELHMKAHAALLRRAGQLKASVAAGKSTLGDLVEFLANTVVAQHLFKEDRKYFPLFKKEDAKAEAFSS